MSLRGLNYYERHFLFSYKMVQFVMGLRPYQNSYEQLLFICTITLYSLPMVLHQVNVYVIDEDIVLIIVIILYQLFISDINFQLTINVLQKTFTILCFIFTYSTTYFSFETVHNICLILHLLFHTEDTFDIYKQLLFIR
ncbi:hypothetical protein V1478_015647 [Vespula squamosa]|uniref:Uncharacterized protein n=1 Tax=Vespula squamosa TaxID=30214 RepID=A0ABD2A1W6_VESSQ